jgi:hypothetical protein
MLEAIHDAHDGEIKFCVKTQGNSCAVIEVNDD